MFEYSPAWPHGTLQAAFSEIYYVVGTNKTHHAGVDIQTSRTMTVVRVGDQLTLLNTVRLDNEGLRALDTLGAVKHIVRLGAFHGRDDPFYCDRYGAPLWAPPGATQADGRAADRTLTPGGPFPVPGSEVFAFVSAKFPEVAIRLEHEGGILVTCDAIQNWARVDAFFSPACGAAFKAQGLIREANIPSTWQQACEPSADDFRRLLNLRFRHLLSAHGEPLRDVAYERVRASVVEAFGEGASPREPPEG